MQLSSSRLASKNLTKLRLSGNNDSRSQLSGHSINTAISRTSSRIKLLHSKADQKCAWLCLGIYRSCCLQGDTSTTTYLPPCLLIALEHRQKPLSLYRTHVGRYALVTPKSTSWHHNVSTRIPVCKSNGRMRWVQRALNKAFPTKLGPHPGDLGGIQLLTAKIDQS
jgi:hypothetical protein